jgi:hypothetical protein
MFEDTSKQLTESHSLQIQLANKLEENQNYLNDFKIKYQNLESDHHEMSIDLDEFDSNEEKEEKGPAIGPDGKIFVLFGEKDGKKVWISPDSIGLGFVEVPEETTEDDIRKKYYSKNPAYASLI